MKKNILLFILIFFFNPLLHSFFDDVNIKVSFEDSLRRYTNATIQEKPCLHLYKKLYSRLNLYCVHPDIEPRIPKIIHQIWLGSPVPDEFKEYMASWQKVHPDWQYRLWTDADVASFGLTNQQVYDAAKNYGQRSDIFRYEILYRFGGLYIDTDFKCLRRFDVFHHCYDFYAGLIDAQCLEIANGLIGITPKHPLMKKVIESIHTASVKNQFQDIIDLTGPGFLTKIFEQVAQKTSLKNIVFPCTFFYPAPNTARFLTTQ